MGRAKGFLRDEAQGVCFALPSADAALALSFGGADRDSARDDFVDLGTVESPLRMIDRCSC
jgi:hypothetical protein